MKENVRNRSIKAGSGKRRLTVILAVFVIFLLVLFLLVNTVLSVALKHAVNTGGPLLTGLDMHLESASVHLIAGYVKLEGFTLKNPRGYRTPDAVSVRKMEASLKVSSFFSATKVVPEFTLSGADIYYEQGLKTNNLNDIIEKLSGLSQEQKAPAAADEVPVKVQIGKLLLEDIKLHAVVSFPGMDEVSTAAFSLPSVSLKDLGTDTDGITVTDLTAVILKELAAQIYETVGRKVEKTADEAADTLKKAGSRLQETGKQTFRKTKELFRKVLPPSGK